MNNQSFKTTLLSAAAAGMFVYAVPAVAQQQAPAPAEGAQAAPEAAQPEEQSYDMATDFTLSWKEPGGDVVSLTAAKVTTFYTMGEGSYNQKYRIENIALTDSGAPDSGFSIASIEAEDPNVGAVMSILGAITQDDSDDMETLGAVRDGLNRLSVGALRLEDVSFKDRGDGFAVPNITLAGVKDGMIGELSMVGTKIMDGDEVVSVDTVNLSNTNILPVILDLAETEMKFRREEEKIPAVFAILKDKLVIGGVEVNGITVNTRDMKAGVKSFKIANVADGNIGEVSLDMLAAAPEMGGSMGLERFSVQDTNLVAVAADIATGIDPNKSEEALAFDAIMAFQTQFNLGLMEMTGLSMDAPEAKVTLDTMRIANFKSMGADDMVVSALNVQPREGGAITLDEARFRTTKRIDDFPVAGVANVSALKITPPQQEQAQMQAMAGIDTILVNMSFASDYDPATKIATLAPWIVNVDKVAEVELNLSLPGYPSPQEGMEMLNQMAAMAEQNGMSAMDNPEMMMMQMYQNTELGPITLRVTDLGIRPYALQMAAPQLGAATPEEAVMGIEQQVTGMLGQVFGPQAGGNMAQAISAFLKEGGSVTLSIKPKQPIKLMEMPMVFSTPEAVAQALDVSIVKQ